jgi:putative nucleotide binding protein
MGLLISIKMEQNKNTKEEIAIVLDFLPNGYPFDKTPLHRRTSIAQAIGTTKFTLLELVPRKGEFLRPMEEVYIGEGKREKIHHINGRMHFDKLTQTAKHEVEPLIKELIHKDESRFVEFFNKAQPLTIRMHSLELLPGVGKKHVRELLNERIVEDFKDFADIKKRVKLMPDPEMVVVKRIKLEMEGKEKHKVFLD